MSHRHQAATVMFGFLCGVASLGALECLVRMDAPAVAQEPTGDRVEKAKLDQEIADINIQYARGFLRIAQLSLEKAQGYNQSVSGSFSQAEVDRLQRLVQVGKERLKWAEARGNQSDANKFSAELAVQAAETTYKKALATNERLPGAVSPITLEQQRLAVELARLSLKKVELVRQTGSQVAELQWQLDQLRDEVLTLRSQLESITSRR
jgi:chromosome segregation ATPase